MQSGFGIGFFLASVAWFFINPLGPNAWRIMFLLGVIPALLTLWIRKSIPESDRWERVNAQRQAATEREKAGASLNASEQALARFTIADLFAEPEIRKRVILAFLISLATTFAFWGISAWLPPYIAAAAGKAGLPPQQWASYAAMANNGAAIIGYAAFGFLADAYGRKPVTIAYVLLAFISVPIVFLWTNDLNMILLAAAFSGAFVSGQYTWMAVWLPELFPTRVRATATAFVAPDRMDRPADLRLADRELWRLQQGGCGHSVHLCAELDRGAVPAGNQREALAGVNLWRLLPVQLTLPT
jgi:MFS family permease